MHYPESVKAMLFESDAPTAPLEEFLVIYRKDPSVWWRVPFEHQKKLFDAALDPGRTST